MVYDFCMCLDALSKSVKFYDMHETFNVLSSKTVIELEEKLDVTFVAQATVILASEALTSDPENLDLAVELMSSQASEAIALLDLKEVDLVTTNLLVNLRMSPKRK